MIPLMKIAVNAPAVVAKNLVWAIHARMPNPTT